MFDIDHFKLYNDRYGHVAGDETLRRVAACIDLVVRAGECAYRYGGEEFLLLMPDCSPAAVLVTAERICRTVLDAGIAHGARPSEPPLVTLSGGVSCWTPGSPLSAREVIEQADEALFQAKAVGRNRIETAPSLRGKLQAAAVG